MEYPIDSIEQPGWALLVRKTQKVLWSDIFDWTSQIEMAKNPDIGLNLLHDFFELKQ